MLLQGLISQTRDFFVVIALAALGRHRRDTLAELPDEALFQRHVENDPGAFEVLFDRYAPTMLAYLKRQLFRPDEANDLLQDIFLQLHRSRGDYDSSRPLRPWLYTIALNLLREHFRRIGRKREYAVAPEEVPQDGGSRSPEQELAAMQVRKALRRLPEDQREAITLHWLEGFSFPEVAAIVGASVSAVKVRAHRGYKALEVELA